MLLQMARFYPFLWPRNIPLYICTTSLSVHLDRHYLVRCVLWVGRKQESFSFNCRCMFPWIGEGSTEGQMLAFHCCGPVFVILEKNLEYSSQWGGIREGCWDGMAKRASVLALEKQDQSIYPCSAQWAQVRTGFCGEKKWCSQFRAAPGILPVQPWGISD